MGGYKDDSENKLPSLSTGIGVPVGGKKFGCVHVAQASECLCVGERKGRRKIKKEETCTLS